MTFRIKALSTAASSLFATGGPVGGTNPDSVTIGDGSVWIEYGNTASSTGGSGDSTIVRYGLNGAIQHTFSIAGEVDGLKVNPVTGMVWALQNQDGNSTPSLIIPRPIPSPVRCLTPRRLTSMDRAARAATTTSRSSAAKSTSATRTQ
jgi:hypothetical protein